MLQPDVLGLIILVICIILFIGKWIPAAATGVLGCLLMVAYSAGLSLLLSRLYGFTTLTAFLALAPGGIAEMCLTGLEMHQDVAVILTYQLVRVLMLAMGVPFVIRKFFKPSGEKKQGV